MIPFLPPLSPDTIKTTRWIKATPGFPAAAHLEPTYDSEPGGFPEKDSDNGSGDTENGSKGGGDQPPGSGDSS